MTHFLFALLGAVGWSLTEYLLHRFRGHAPTGTSRFKKEHLRHHAEVDYFAPFSYKVVSALPPTLVLAAASSLILGWSLGLALTGGFLKAYIGYELCHRRLHTHPPRGAWGRRLRLHHFAHHFADARCNHGVTSALWDRAFGTRQPVQPLPVPARRAPVWLRTEPGEQLPEALARDYRLTPSGRASL